MLAVLDQYDGKSVKTMPIIQSTTNKEILEKLITEARKYVKIKTLLIDREFSNSTCIQKLEELNVKFNTCHKTSNNVSTIVKSTL